MTTIDDGHVTAPLQPPRLRVRLYSLLAERGTITRPRLTAYLGDLLNVGSVDVRDEILIGWTEGLYVLAWRHTRDGLAVELSLGDSHAAIISGAPIDDERIADG